MGGGVRGWLLAPLVCAAAGCPQYVDDPLTGTRYYGLDSGLPRAGSCVEAPEDPCVSVYLPDGGIAPYDGGTSRTDAGGETMDGGVTSPVTGQWTAVASLASTREYHTAVVGADGRIYVMGGWNMTLVATTEMYTPATNTWLARASMPTPRFNHAAALGSDGRIYVFGGRTPGVVANVDAYSTSGNAWTASTALPVARYDLNAVASADGSKIYVMGGIIDNGTTMTTRLDIFNVGTQTWSLGAAMPTARAASGAALGLDGRVYVFGGSQGMTKLTSVVAYNPTVDKWTTVATTMPSSSYAVAATANNDERIYVFGDGFALRYLPSTDAWSTFTNFNTSREGFAVVSLSDKRMYAIAGYRQPNFQNVVEVFAP